MTQSTPAITPSYVPEPSQSSTRTEYRVTDFVFAQRCAPTELDVGIQNAGVDDVGVDTRSGGVVDVRATERQAALIDAVEPPRGIRLFVDGVCHLILLHVCHEGVVA